MFDLFKNLILEGRIESIFPLSEDLLSRNPNLPPEHIDLLKALTNGQIETVITRLNQLSVKYPNDQSLSFFKDYLEKNKSLIEKMYEFLKRFDSEKPKISIFTDSYFLIGQEVTENDGKIRNLDDLRKIASNTNPNLVYHNGKIYDLVATSTPKKFLSNILSEDLKGFMQDVEYYEGLYYLFEKIDEKVQKVFSENSIGIYILNKEIYFIKFVPLLQIEQDKSQSKVIVLDLKNSGKIIGVKIEGYNTLSDVIQFEFDDDASGFVPKFSLDVSIFFSSKKLSIDFGTEQGLKEFCKDLNERIDTAIEILNGNKQFALNKPEEIKMYTEFEIQKIQKLNNLKARVSKLSALLKLRQTPDMYIKIKEKLEENFIIYFDFLMRSGQINEINEALNSIEKIKIFDAPESRRKLLNILSLGLLTTKLNPKDAIALIKDLETRFAFKSEDYRIFSDGYMRVVAKIAPAMILDGRIDDLRKTIDMNYLNNNSELISILVSVLINIRFETADRNLSLQNFLRLINVIFDFIKNSSDKSILNARHRNNLENYFRSLITHSAFVSDLLKENSNFLEILFDLKDFVFNDPKKDFKEFMNLFDEALIRNQIEPNSIEFNETRNLHKNVLGFYKKNHPEQYLHYLSNLISEFNRLKPNEITSNQLIYFKMITAEILKQFSKELKKPSKALLSLIESFLDNWYLYSNFNSLFATHYEIIESLGRFYGDKNRLERMKRNVKLNETLSIINSYQDRDEIERILEAYLKDHVQKSELFETEYFEYLEALLKRDYSVFFDFSCVLFHLNAVQRVYKGQNNPKINQTFNLFEEQLSRFFEVKIKDSFFKTVREYLERVEKFVPSILKNPNIYILCLESLRDNIQMDSNLSEVCLLFCDLYEKMKKFSNFTSAKELFVSLAFQLMGFIISSLNADLISKPELNFNILEAFFKIIFENLDPQNQSVLAFIGSMNFALENISKFPISLDFASVFVLAMKDVIANLSDKMQKNLFAKTVIILNNIESELKQRNEIIQLLNESIDGHKLNKIKENLQNKIARAKGTRFDYHILVLVCKMLQNIDQAINYAIEGMNIEGFDTLSAKIMRNFIKLTKLTTKKEFDKNYAPLIRTDLRPYIRSALA